MIGMDECTNEQMSEWVGRWSVVISTTICDDDDDDAMMVVAKEEEEADMKEDPSER